MNKGRSGNGACTMGFRKSKTYQKYTVRKKSFEEQLRMCRDEIRQSRMFKELCISLEPFRNSIVKVRCLAIGSFHDEFPAKYQLALLCELLEYLPPHSLVSLYDPVLTPEDCCYISNLKNWSVDEVAPDWIQESSNILFFLPHAPLNLTEQVLDKEHPRLWLANHTVAHTDRYTNLQLYEKYPTISKLVHLLNQELPPASDVTTASNADEFTTFIPRRKRKNKKKFEEVRLDYTLIKSYFESCKILQNFDEGALLKNQPWINSFSDLALHLIE